MSATITPTKPKRALRWPEVHARTGISKSAWERGQRAGVFPAPFKLGPPPTRAVGWLESDIDALIERLAAQREAA
jgi:prophage regulatory protein